MGLSRAKDPLGGRTHPSATPWSSTEQGTIYLLPSATASGHPVTHGVGTPVLREVRVSRLRASWAGVPRRPQARQQEAGGARGSQFTPAQTQHTGCQTAAARTL